MKISVEKITNNENTYRTPLDKIDRLQKEPRVGESMTLESSTFESGGIMTSIVLDVIKVEDGYVVKTMKSTYIIKIIKEH